jgi:hypothetical protein
LSNVTALTRTLIDLVSNAVHSADLGGKILVHIEDAQEGGQEGAVELTIGYDAREEAEKMAQALIPDPKNHPRLFLAQRTIRSCGGSFYAERSQDARWTLRVTLPKNAAGHEKGPANKRVSE